MTGKRSDLFLSALKKLIFTGWKISVTGVFPVSFGGDTGFRPGIIKKRVRSMWTISRRQTLKTGSKTPLFSIHGSVLHYGRFQRWAGLIRMHMIIKDIIRPMRL